MENIRFYCGTPGWGWTMWGVGYKSDWFIGFSMRRVERQYFVEKDKENG